MAFDSSTLCARTTAGDAELSLPALGLSLSQRRVLTLLQNPSAAVELAQTFHLEPVKLERDLTRLADLRLVVLQGATIAALPTPVPVPSPPTAGAMAPVVIGGSTRRNRAKALAVGSVALLVAAALWFGTRSGDPERHPVPAAAVATLSPAASIPSESPTPTSRVANESAPVTGMPATAMVLRGNAPPPERRVEIRPGLSALAASASAPAVVPDAAPVTPVARQVPSTRPENAPINIAPGPSMTTPTATPLATLSAVANTAAEPPSPMQLAAAKPSPAPRPAAPAPLKAISREQPEFPKEATAIGLKSGSVTARLHVDAGGKVTSVDILGAQPPRVFDRAVRRALLQWQFEPPATGAAAAVDVDIEFQRD